MTFGHNFSITSKNASLPDSISVKTFVRAAAVAEDGRHRGNPLDREPRSPSVSYRSGCAWLMSGVYTSTRAHASVSMAPAGDGYFPAGTTSASPASMYCPPIVWWQWMAIVFWPTLSAAAASFDIGAVM